MKAKIHPTWFEKATVRCACGNEFTVGATVENLKVDICSKCHPFFTGKMKFVDTMGRVEKFQKKQKHAQKHKEAVAEKKKKRQDRETQLREQKSLKDMLMGMR